MTRKATILIVLLGLCLGGIVLTHRSTGRRLHEAIRTNDLATFRRLLTKENVNTSNQWSVDNSTYLIHDTCSWKRLAFLRMLLEYGADARVLDARGQTCLFSAIGAGDEPEVAIQLVTLLCNHDPTLITLTDPRYGNSALHYAAQLSNDPRLIAKLIELGADIGVKNSEGKTAFDLNSARRRKDPLVGKLLQTSSE